MARYYGLKIQKKEMELADVPRLWKKVTEKWLNENQEAANYEN